jgi:hypothetical protein
VLLALPACAADFDEAYLPITDVALADITVGMDWEDFEKEHLENQYVSIPRHGFFRVNDGRSVMVVLEYTGDSIREIFVFERTTLASKSEFRALKKGISMQEIIEKVGLPVSKNTYLSSAHVLYFPVSNGQICSMRIRPTTYVLESIEFLNELPII